MKTIIEFQFFIYILLFIQFELNFRLVAPVLLSASPFTISATCSALSVDSFSSGFFFNEMKIAVKFVLSRDGEFFSVA